MTSHENTRIRAWRAVKTTLRAGAADYERRVLLPRLLPVAAADIDRDDAAVTGDILRRLARAIRGERSRGRAGHWTYDPNRHLGLIQAHRREALRLRQTRAATRDCPDGTTSPATAILQKS